MLEAAAGDAAKELKKAAKMEDEFERTAPGDALFALARQGRDVRRAEAPPLRTHTMPPFSSTLGDPSIARMPDPPLR